MRRSMPILGTFMLILGMLSGCASTLPLCPDAQLSIIEAEGARLYVFDEPNWQRAVATLRGLNEGACRLRVPESIPERPAGRSDPQGVPT